MLGIIFKTAIFFIFFVKLNSQPDARFRPFDWVTFKGPGAITSITEGYTFAYLGTKNGGIKRFNLYGNYFDFPIGVPQGLKNDNVTALHFDKITGILWVATKGYIHHSFSREGEWFAIELQQLGLSRYDNIERIGSSTDHIWLKARSSFIKLDHSTGILNGIYPNPDELNIEWSSGPYNGDYKSKEVLNNYSILDGWIYNGDELIDNLGRRSTITTIFFGNHGNIFFGSSDGNIFYGTTTMQTFSPIVSDIINNDIESLFTDESHLWIGSKDYITSKSITKLNKQSLVSESYLFEETINMTPTSIFSMYAFKNELWAGGESLILYLNEKEQFWRTLGQERGVPNGKIYALHGNETHVWVGSSKGISRIERATLSEDPIGIEEYFSNMVIYDIEIINGYTWIGTNMGLYIFSNNDPKLLSLNDIGRKNFPENMNKVTCIQEYNDLIYIISDIGIVKFNMQEQNLKLIFTSGIYYDKAIYAMNVNEKFIFLGTGDGLIKINKNTGLVKDYLLPFLGQVNDIVIDGKKIWLGTSNGLVRFLWKRDL